MNFSHLFFFSAFTDYVYHEPMTHRRKGLCDASPYFETISLSAQI